jgi:mannose-1-phosphate guanylyltransferase
MYALIMAGGKGTRLWPLSRRGQPKQLLELLFEKTLLQQAYERISPLIPDENIFIATVKSYAEVVREQIPHVPASNIVIEPEGRGTAPCIGLAALYLRREDPDAVMAVLTSDHIIEDEEGFRRSLLAAAEVAKEGYLVTFGIKPDRPHTGYGYIKRGEVLKKIGGYEVFGVERFTEKPDLAKAWEFLESGDYYWNSGMFIWKASTVLREIERLMPKLHAQLMEIDAYIGTERERDVLEAVWAGVEEGTIDYGVMERAADVVVIPVDIGWSDVGSWATIYELLPSDEEGNVIVGEHVGLDTTGSLILSQRRLVATIGLEGMIVVDAEGVVLICPKERAQDVKRLVEELKKKGMDAHL